MIRKRPPALDGKGSGCRGSPLSAESPISPATIGRSVSEQGYPHAPAALANFRVASDSVMLIEDPKSIGQLALRHQLALIRSTSSQSLADISAAPPPLVTVGGTSRKGAVGEVGPRKSRLSLALDDLSSDGSKRPWSSDSRASSSGSSMGSLESTGRPAPLAPPAYTASPVHASTAAAPRRPRKQGLQIEVSTSGEEDDDEIELSVSSSSSSGSGGRRRRGSSAASSMRRAGEAEEDDFVFQPSQGIKAARALGLRQDAGEAEGRAVYSKSGGNFDLGGFKIGSSGLVSSPRNRGRRRPSLNEGDNFVILARVGSGSSSSVHKAIHLPTMRLVALKALPLYDAERRAQLMRELRVLYSNLASISNRTDSMRRRQLEKKRAGGEAELSPQHGQHDDNERKDDEDGNGEQHPCPYIVSFYDAFADAKHGCLNLVVEYMDGGSLQDLVDRGGCADETILAHLSYNILMGLSYLHGMKKIHRDIKPSNLLINSQGYVKIADFGVSRSLDGASGNDLADTFIGTLGFMSPERITGQEYSYGADMWGFGLSILACALGSFPLLSSQKGSSGGYWGLVHAVCEDPAPEVPDTFSAPFRDLVSRCLVKDPSKRSSAKELLAHPFITSRPTLPVDDDGRPAYMHESREVRVLELEGICRAIALHLTNRSSNVNTKSAATGGGSASSSPTSGKASIDSHSISLLAEELVLEDALVAAKFNEQFAAIASAAASSSSTTSTPSTSSQQEQQEQRHQRAASSSSAPKPHASLFSGGLWRST